jgi:hypothetical protein
MRVAAAPSTKLNPFNSSWKSHSDPNPAPNRFTSTNTSAGTSTSTSTIASTTNTSSGGVGLVRKRSLYGPAAGATSPDSGPQTDALAASNSTGTATAAANTNTRTSTSTSSKPKKQKASPAIQEYIAQIKSALEKDEFKNRFVPLLRTYKTDAKRIPLRAMMTLIAQFRLLFHRLGAAGDELVLGFRRTLPAEKQAEFDTAHARLATDGGGASAALGISGDASADEAAAAAAAAAARANRGAAGQASGRAGTGKGEGGGGGGHRLSAAEAGLLNGSGKKRPPASARHTAIIDRIPGFAANREAAAATSSTITGIGVAGSTSVGMEPMDVGGANKRARSELAEARTSVGTIATKTARVAGGCSQCKGVPVAPFSAPCQHVCCYSCWMQLLHAGTATNGLLCPEPSCCRPIKKKELRKCYF